MKEEKLDEENEAFNRALEIKLKDLQKKVNNNKFLKVSEWGGADVIICNKPKPFQKSWLGEQPGVVISFQNTEPRRRLVITNHSKELSWLFEQLRDIFRGRIDYVSKYDFFGSLAQAAMDCLEETKGEVECKILLTKVIDAAKKFGEQQYLLIIENRSLTLYNEKRFAESVDVYDNVMRNKPNNDGLWHGKGYALYRLNRYEDAIQALNKGLEINPDNSILWVGKGYARFWLGIYDEAVEAYDRAITLDPTNPKNAVLRESKGDALCHLKRYEEAIVVYEEIIETNPGNPKLWDKKGEALCQLGKLDDAEKCSSQADKLRSKRGRDQ